MSDLPTRESIELATGFEIRDWTALDTERVYAIVDAYLDVTLMTEAEWWAKLPDGDLFVRQCGPTAACSDGQVLPYPHVEKCFVKLEKEEKIG